MKTKDAELKDLKKACDIILKYDHHTRTRMLDFILSHHHEKRIIEQKQEAKERWSLLNSSKPH